MEAMKDISKAIQYLLKCYNIEYQCQCPIPIDGKVHCPNVFRYRSSNDLGLIYITILDDHEKASIYLKEAAFAEYPFGQSNWGLFNEFFLNNCEKAEYFYKRSSEHKFALAEYNLGHLYEKNGKIEESIKYYILASDHINELLFFHTTFHSDFILEISKEFVISYSDIKLVKYFLLKHNFDDAKKYYQKVFSRIKNDKYLFQFCFPKDKSKNVFSYLKAFIFGYPIFNITNQPNVILDPGFQKEIEDIQSGNEIGIYSNEKTKKKQSEKKVNDKMKSNEGCDSEYLEMKKLKEYEKMEQIKEYFYQIEMIEEINKYPSFEPNDTNENINNDINNQKKPLFDNPENLFDYIVDNNERIMNTFIDELDDIMDTFENILYTYPYSILFGRISNFKPKPKPKEVFYKNMKDINNIFYEGFGIEIQ